MTGLVPLARAQFRLVVAMVRPPVYMLLVLAASVGLGEAGRPDDMAAIAVLCALTAGFLLAAAAWNDLADVAADRVNLPGDAGRPLAAGSATRLAVAAAGGTGATVSLLAAWSLGTTALAVTAAGLLLAAAYSLPPLRISARGALASLVLPAGYVAVPYLCGVLAARHQVRASDLTVLAGLYVGFIGRILLKDFRDVRGDAMFGKRTFLVRHGRRVTCAASAALWVAGSSVLAAVPGVTPALAGAYLVLVAAAVRLIAQLAVTADPHAEESIVAAVAVCGRGLMLLLLAHYGLRHEAAEAALGQVLVAALGAFVLALAWTTRRSPYASTLRLPAGMDEEAPSRSR